MPAGTTDRAALRAGVVKGSGEGGVGQDLQGLTASPGVAPQGLGVRRLSSGGASEAARMRGGEGSSGSKVAHPVLRQHALGLRRLS